MTDYNAWNQYKEDDALIETEKKHAIEDYEYNRIKQKANAIKSDEKILQNVSISAEILATKLKVDSLKSKLHNRRRKANQQTNIDNNEEVC